MPTCLSILLLTLFSTSPGAPAAELTPFELALDASGRALAAGDLAGARRLCVRALERDQAAPRAWALRARIAEAAGERDELVYALHREHRLARAQGAPRAELERQRARLVELDPLAADLDALRTRHVARLRPIAERYEKEGRPHGAIRVHKQIQALDPDDALAPAAIERIAAAPDPSLAADAVPRDLFADVSAEWIRAHDQAHGTWKERASLERENYTTETDAGYQALVRAAEAMEQMNAFYRVFFRHGTPAHKGSVPRIGIHIFKSRAEYLELGSGPPVEWSAGQFTGSHVETYVGDGGFEDMTNTLFHEAAHQFVSLATRAAGWLNEGLASFFEGCRILPNGTVLMNLPADHRLIPLAERLERGFMARHDDGIGEDPNKEPERAPTFRIVLEDEYAWGPPWYAPTWGVVYFLFNYQDPLDGRFVYRAAFQEFIDASGGRMGKGAVENFEKVVLASPSKPLAGVERPADARGPALPKTAAELDPVFKDWILALRDERQGKLEVARPYKLWGRYAAQAGDYAIAAEHYEKGLLETPGDVELLLEFAELLEKRCANPDRAAKLVGEAILLLEAAPAPDEKAIAAAERLLTRLDPKRKTLASVRDDIAADARSIVARYAAAKLPLMVMDVSWRLGNALGLSELFTTYEDAVRTSGKTLEIYELAYNERDLDGWNDVGESRFRAAGSFLEAENGRFEEGNFDYQILTLERVTAGDFTLEAEVEVARGEVSYAGFVFGRKGASTFHGMLLFPGAANPRAGVAQTGWIDLMSSFGGGRPQTWRHVPVDTGPAPGGRTVSARPHTLRLDVSGPTVDLWYDGGFVATHEFRTPEVLRGSFGLICGRGKARFRDVRFLARDPRDLAGRIVRSIEMEALRSAAGGAVDGSYLGQVAPWPSVARWLQGERGGWADVGGAPQLLAFFSIQQNELVPIDGWLRALHAATRELGLELVCVAGSWDDAAIDAWLRAHPLPGAVGVDARTHPGAGDSAELYSLARFNLPRLILVDLDHTVAWEGDPGFKVGSPWVEGAPTYLDDPLAELASKRELLELRAWRRDWDAGARAALHAGDLASAIGVLGAARELDARYSPEVSDAQRRLAALEAALAAPAATVGALAREEAEPALDVLAEWAPLVGRRVDAKLLQEVRASAPAKDWEAALRRISFHAKSRQRRDGAEGAADLLDKLAPLAGRFARELTRDLRDAHERGDHEAFERSVDAALARPRTWLARELFHW